MKQKISETLFQKHQNKQLVDEIFFNASCLSLVNYVENVIIVFFNV